MLVESRLVKNFRLLDVRDDTFNDDDLKDLRKLVESYVEEGETRIAILSNPNAYPYSKLISALVQCNQIVAGKDGQLAVIQPNKAFLDVLQKMRLDVVMGIHHTLAEFEASLE